MCKSDEHLVISICICQTSGKWTHHISLIETYAFNLLWTLEVYILYICRSLSNYLLLKAVSTWVKCLENCISENQILFILLMWVVPVTRHPIDFSGTRRIKDSKQDLASSKNPTPQTGPHGKLSSILAPHQDKII